MNYVIYTENTADLPSELIKKHNIQVLNMEFILNEQTYSGEQGNTLDPQTFYAAMREGKKTSTSQVAPQTYIDLFSKQFEQGKDVLYLAFSSGLSGSYNSAVMAEAELATLYPNRKLIIIDTLSASLGQGMLVLMVAEYAKTASDIAQVAIYAQNLVPKVSHLFTVDDLNHLYRGGRLSKTSAVLGTLLHLKPLLHLNNQGKIVPYAKVIGRNKAFQTLLQTMQETIHLSETKFVAIGHGDCLAEAQKVGDMIRQQFKIETIYYNHIGTVIGSHSGPGTLAVFYIGSARAMT